MKKTLLIAAAALAASVISSQAQVYSQNVVGYYNTVVPAGSFALIANQLVSGDDSAKTNNSINGIFSGLKSDVNANNNTVLYKWTGAGYGIFQYFTGADADAWFGNTGSINGFYDATGVLVIGSLNQGGGSFLYNPSGSSITNTTVGTVPQGTNVLTITPGFNIYSLIPPISAGLEVTNSFAQFPGTSDVNAVNNDVLYKWTGAGYGIFQYFTGADADAWFGNTGSINGFYDATGVQVSSAPKVGEGFFLFHTGASKSWTNSLIVQ